MFAGPLNNKGAKKVFEATHTDYLVPYDGSFRIEGAPTHPSIKEKWRNTKRLKTAVAELDELQRVLWASDRHALLIIFQGMDSAGKDSTIRAVMRGINPAGCQVFSFKKPSEMDLDHDFLWRTSRSLPERGRIGIFNRSQYEEVLVVRVHPEILTKQKLPETVDLDTIWDERLESIRDQELHLARNGTVILKFWLNLSREEQKKRFLARLDKPHKHWKFNAADVEAREHWDSYMHAYEAALNATSRPWAPWYAIPADSKPYMRARVAETIVQALSGIDLAYPQPSGEDKKKFKAARMALTGPDGQ
jgi:PPK2 family polyphosphate:nucleotide phosphotransferase